MIARLSDLHGGGNVLKKEKFLHGHPRWLKFFDHFFKFAVNFGQTIEK